MNASLITLQLKSGAAMLLAILASLGWLLPSRFYPWPGFHQDALITLVSLVCGGGILLMSRRAWYLPSIGCVFLVLASVPIFQWINGQILFFGAASISTAYVLGFAAVVVFAARAEEINPYFFLDRLFFSIGLAAIVTVWVQLYQWLGLVSPDDWWAAGVDAVRPSGNFSQPNHAATFLLWGLCAVAWASWRRHIGWFCAVLMAMYLLFGVTLTGSRTPWIGVAAVVTAVFWWRKYWMVQRVPWVVLGLAGYFFALRLALERSGAMPTDLFSESTINIRWLIWQVTLDGLKVNPWWGYGWDQIYHAQLLMADKPSGLDDVFSSSHNLFLDIFLFMGLPLGILLICCLVLWVMNVFSKVKCASHAILFIFIIPVAVHSMFEYPLQYAHLLLPTGWIIGSLHAKVFKRSSSDFVVPYFLVALFYCLMLALFLTICSDYSKIEKASRSIRSQVANNSLLRSAAPEVLLLNQLSSQLELMRMPDLGSDLNAEQLDMIEGVALLPTSRNLLVKAAKLLAINHRTEQAIWILRRYCGVASELSCKYGRERWNRLGKTQPEIARIPWTSGLAEASR